MAICNDCAHNRYCTFPRTEQTSLCEEYDNLQQEQKPDDWNLKVMLEEWGFAESGKD